MKHFSTNTNSFRVSNTKTFLCLFIIGLLLIDYSVTDIPVHCLKSQVKNIN